MGGDIIAGAIWYIAMPVEQPSTASKANIERESEEAPSSGDTVPCIIGFDTWIVHNPLMVFNEFGRNTIW